MIEAAIHLYERDVRDAEVRRIEHPDKQEFSVLSISDMKIYVRGEGADQALEEVVAILRRHFGVEGA